MNELENDPGKSDGPDPLRGQGIPADPRDELARIRTDLANERTLLAYIRTSLMMAGTGGTLIRFFGDSPDMLSLGFASLGIGIVTFLTGMIRFRSQAKRIRC